MNDKNKTKAQLIEEMAVLRERNAELEAREAEHQSTTQVQAALYRIADAASAVEDMQEFYATIHQIVGELMYAENFFIALYDAERQQMRFVYMIDTVDEPPDPQRWYPLSQGSTGYVLRTGQPMLNMEQYDQLIQTGEIVPGGTRAYDGAVVPLEVDRHAIGVLGIQSYIEGIGYTDQDRELLIFVAQHIATALERARLLDDTRQRNAELAIINSVSEGLVKQLEFQAIIDLVGDKIRETFQADTTYIILYDRQAKLMSSPYYVERGHRHYHEPETPGRASFSWHIVQTNEALLFNNMEEQIAHGAARYIPSPGAEKDLNESYLGVPVHAGQTSGVLSVQSYKKQAYSESDLRLLSTIAANLGVALENARLFDETTRLLAESEAQVTELSTLNIISQGLVGQLDLQSVIDLVGDKIREITQVPTFGISLYNAESNIIDDLYYFDEDRRVPNISYPLGKGLSSIVIHSGQFLMLDTFQEMLDLGVIVPEHRQDYSLLPEVSWLGVPILIGQQVTGVMFMVRRQNNAFSETDVRLLTTVAANMGVAIENARLFDETTRLLAESEEQVAELSTLNIISQGLVAQLDLQGVVDLVGDKIREIISADAFNIALYDAKSNLLNFPYFYDGDTRIYDKPRLLEGGLTATIIQMGQPVVISTKQEMLDRKGVIPEHRRDSLPGELSWLGVPILIGQEATGTIYILKFQDHAFTEADVQLLSTIAANMGVAIENARLFDEIQQTNQDLSQTLEELKSTQGQLVEAEKMAALGGLVAGVAHEINTPVGVGVTAASTLQDKTSGFSEIYKSGQMKRSDLEKYLDMAEQSSAMILRNLERAAELIQSFKQVAVDQSSEGRREFPVKAYLDEILLSLRPQLKKTQHTIEINGDDSLTLDSYPGAFSQIVTNLVMNSLLHAYGPDEWGQLTFDFKQNDGLLIFEYNDDGKGIPEENLSKIFEPFFTTKRTQGGSGLGLHIIYNLVTQRMGGTINCESEVDSGTKFVIEIPIS